VEALTRDMQAACNDYFRRIAERGGMLAAIESGFFRREIAESAFRYQQEIDRSERLIVGVNAFQQAQESPIETLTLDPAVEREQVESLRVIKQQRSAAAVQQALDCVRAAAERGENVLPPLIDAAEARVTVQEAMDALARVFGRYCPRAEL
jgi:methylmalonyl-CoA mutase N-terminal domain/subunit